MMSSGDWVIASGRQALCRIIDRISETGGQPRGAVNLQPCVAAGVAAQPKLDDLQSGVEEEMATKMGIGMID